MMYFAGAVFELAQYHLENVDNIEVISWNSVEMLLKLGITKMSRN